MTDNPPLSKRDLASHHLLIAGTGRAGTSYLVRFLGALGLETGFSGADGADGWDAEANAGLEHSPLAAPDERLPYVVKSPWIGEYADEIFKSQRYKIDALVIPMRDLVEAATSRAIVEHRAIFEKHPWIGNLDRTWEAFGETPGGIVYSLNPVDQARLLAVNFHTLVHQAIVAEIPIVFLAFPRMAEDWRYLYRQLQPVLPATVTEDAARLAHAAITDLAKVRVRREVRGDGPAQEARMALHYPDSSEIDGIALRRELGRLHAKLKDGEAELGALRMALEGVQSEAADLRSHNAELLVRGDVTTRWAEERRLALETAQQKVETARLEAAALRSDVERLSAALAAQRRTFAYRVTKLARGALRPIRVLLRRGPRAEVRE